MPFAPQDNPFLQLDSIRRVVQDMVPADAAYGLIDTYIPSTEQPVEMGTSIKWDIEVNDQGGLLPLTDPNATSPLITGGASRSKRWSPPHYRAKTRLDASNILNLRELGSTTQARTMGREMVKAIARLRGMLDNRIYWSKWHAMQAAAAFNVYGPGVIQRLDYSGIGYHPTVAVDWDAPGATIIDDIIGFVNLFRQDATIPRAAFYGSDVMEAMLADTTVCTLITNQIYRDVQQRNIFNTIPGQTGLEAFLKTMFAGIEFNYYNKGPVVSLKVPRNSDDTTVPVVGPANMFRNGETVWHVHPNGTRSEITNITVNPGAGTIASADLTMASPVGTLFRKRYEFCEFGQFNLFADVPMPDSEPLVEFVSVGNVHGQGGLERPESGIATRILDNKDQDPPSKEAIISITGGVVAYIEDGLWLSATTLS